jgi:hypothetical protein
VPAAEEDIELSRARVRKSQQSGAEEEETRLLAAEEDGEKFSLSGRRFTFCGGIFFSDFGIEMSLGSQELWRRTHLLCGDSRVVLV